MATGRTKHRILIVDDHPIIRRGLSELIGHEPDMEVCGGAESVADVLQQADVLDPDLIIVDISLKDGNGIQLISQLAARGCTAQTLVWSMFDEVVYAERALRAGALGYMNKQAPIETVIDAIRQVLQGDVFLSPAMANYLVQRVGGGAPLGEDPVRGLSNRELEVFSLIGRGMTTQQIAGHLKLSGKTIETHRERVKMKLGLKNAAELSQRAVLWVLENG